MIVIILSLNDWHRYYKAMELKRWCESDLEDRIRKNPDMEEELQGALGKLPSVDEMSGIRSFLTPMSKYRYKERYLEMVDEIQGKGGDGR